MRSQQFLEKEETDTIFNLENNENAIKKTCYKIRRSFELNIVMED